jgi:hypothetical protein
MAIKPGLFIGVLCLLAATASADSFSFTGTFQTDNDVQLFNFTIAAETTVTFVTFGFAGGTNAADQVIPPGGFDPEIWLFDPSGNEVASNDNGTGAEVGIFDEAQLDSYLQQEDLSPGTYTLALTESGNTLVDGLTLGGGFNGGGPFNTANCDSNVAFCDFQGDNLDGNWALDILGADSASEPGAPVGTPEPGSMVLLSSGLACFSWVRRRKLSR